MVEQNGKKKMWEGWTGDYFLGRSRLEVAKWESRKIRPDPPSYDGWRINFSDWEPTGNLGEIDVGRRRQKSVERNRRAYKYGL